jgi:glycine/D-amino acid oxidase-like deaminating enzyme
VGKLARSVRDVDFANVKSLFYASNEGDVEWVDREYHARKRAGFAVQLLSEKQLRDSFGLEAPSAILSQLGARIDPYRMTWRLLARHTRRGASVYDRTEVTEFHAKADNVIVELVSGASIQAQHLIVAAGYESQKWLPEKVARNRSSYAFITDPLDRKLLARLADTMAWESAHPYIYLRTTGDGRLLVGGEDDAVDIAAKRDLSVEAKTKRLLEKLERALPRLKVTPAYAWGGTFAETSDGLPYFGPHSKWGPRVHFAMAYGGNGITYSSIGAEIIRSKIEGEEHPLGELFSFARDELRVRPVPTEDLASKVRNMVPEFIRNALPLGRAPLG